MLRDLGGLPLTDISRQAYEEVFAEFPTAVSGRWGKGERGFGTEGGACMKTRGILPRHMDTLGQPSTRGMGMQGLFSAESDQRLNLLRHRTLPP